MGPRCARCRRGAERPLQDIGGPAPPPGPAPRLRLAHARGTALRGAARARPVRSRAALSAPFMLGSGDAATQRSGARAQRPRRPARRGRPRGGASGRARRWPAAGRARGCRVSRGATFPAGSGSLIAARGVPSGRGERWQWPGGVRGDCGARVRDWRVLRLRPGARVCPGAVSAKGCRVPAGRSA